MFIGLFYLGMRIIIVPDVTVPNVQGKLTADALHELEAAGLEGVVTSRQFNTELEIDRVISQKPLPDEKAKRGRNIELIVSQGPQLEIVPNVKGLSQTEAGLS